MLYLDYAKQIDSGYILNLFADSFEDIKEVSNGKSFVTKNGTNYGVPQAGSTVTITTPNAPKTTYVIDAEGTWVVAENISYSAVVANPTDEATEKLEKLKVNDTTYGVGSKLYRKTVIVTKDENKCYFTTFESNSNKIVGRYRLFGIGSCLIDGVWYPCNNIRMTEEVNSETDFNAQIGYVKSEVNVFVAKFENATATITVEEV
jgi:hypothetical protein